MCPPRLRENTDIMFDKEIYLKRREELRKRVGSGVIILPANPEAPVNYPANTFHFRQDSTFLYYFGVNMPDYIGIIDCDNGTDEVYGNDYTIDDIIWMGPQPSVADQAAEAGVTSTFPLSAVAETINKVISRGRRVHFLPPYRGEITLLLGGLLGIQPQAISKYISVELALAVVAMREIKDAVEVAEIEKACEIGYRMQTTAMRMCRPGVVEREIAGAIEGVALQYGSGVSFHSIVTERGETLHNHYHGNVLKEGRMMLVDCGAESVSNYCCDYTRTMPISGKFTTKQKEIYDIVLAANTRAFELASPGHLYRDIYISSAKILIDGLKALGLMQGDTDEAVAVGAQAMFMPHGLGHQMGLDVHDMENIGENYVGYDAETLRSSTPGLSSLRMGKRLKSGMVMTVEPGIYFIPDLIYKWEKEGLGRGFINFKKVREYLDFGGIRLEDDILITETGNRMLGTQRPPITTDEVEAITGKGL